MTMSPRGGRGTFSAVGRGCGSFIMKADLAPCQVRRMKKILLVRFSSIGDIILTTPLVRALGKRFPDARLDYLTKSGFGPLLAGNPHLNRIIGLDGETGFAGLRVLTKRLKAEGGYDLVLDLHGNPRSWYVRGSKVGRVNGRARKNRLRRWLLINAGMDLYRPAALPMAERYFSALDGIVAPPLGPDGEGAELHLNGADREEAALFGERGGKYLVVAPSARWPTKRWPADRFAKAGEVLAEKIGTRVVLLGGGEDAELCESVASRMNCETVNAAGRLSLRGAAALIEGASGFVGNDTGLMHMAGALNTPGVAVFGPTTRHLGFFPYKSPVRVVERNDIGCRPCTKQGQRKCPKKHFACMNEISVEDVVDEAIRAISK